MSSVHEIESAIRGLSEADLAALRAWFMNFDSDAWDRQIAQDADSGRLEALYQKLERENQGQPEIPLDDLLDQG